MPETKISQANYTAMNGIDQTSEDKTDFRRTIDTAQQDFPGTRYYPDWEKWWGIYKVIPDIHALIDKLAASTEARGFAAPLRSIKAGAALDPVFS